MKKVYPSDITREQFSFILPMLETARKKTKPRTIDLYEVFCAILYLLKSGCQWRMSMAYAASRFSKMEDSALIFSTMEYTHRQRS